MKQYNYPQVWKITEGDDCIREDEQTGRVSGPCSPFWFSLFLSLVNASQDKPGDFFSKQ